MPVPTDQSGQAEARISGIYPSHVRVYGDSYVLLAPSILCAPLRIRNPFEARHLIRGAGLPARATAPTASAGDGLYHLHDLMLVLAGRVRVVLAALFDDDILLDLVEQVEPVADLGLAGCIAAPAVSFPEGRF